MPFIDLAAELILQFRRARMNSTCTMLRRCASSAILAN